MAGILDELTEELKRESQPAAPSSSKRPAIIDELKQEIASEPKKKSVRQELEAELDANPESLKKRKASGEPLTVDQERIVWEAERARPTGEKVWGALAAFPGAVVEGFAPIVKGAATWTKDVVEGASAAMIPTGKSQGWDSPSGVGDVRPAPLSDVELVQKEELEKLKKEKTDLGVRALRHIPIGAVNAGEDIAAIPAKAAMGGSAITDALKEAAFGQSPEQSFQNSLVRQDFDRARQADNEANPDRAAIGMARLAESSGTEFGKNIGAELREMALRDVDQNMVSFWDFLAPGVGEEQLLRLSDKPLKGAMKATGKGLEKVVLGAPVPEVVKKFIPIQRAGIAPAIEKTGELGLNLNSAIDRKARQLSKMISGDEDALFRHAADPLKPFIYVPGKLAKKGGEVATDLGKQIDKGGSAGRMGLAQRAGEDAASGEFTKKLFSGPGGKLRAQAFDTTASVLNYAGARGVQGGVVQTLLGLGNIENPETAMQTFGTGFGIGQVSAMLPSNMAGAYHEARIENENADITRARQEAAPELAASIDQHASPSTWAEYYRNRAKETAKKIEVTYATPNSEDERARLIQEKLLDEATAARLALVDPTGPEAEAAKRQAWLGFTDVSALVKPMLSKDGFGDLEIKLLTPETIPAFVNSIRAPELAWAQSVLAEPASSAAEKTQAQAVLDKVADEIKTFSTARGATFSSKDSAFANSSIPGYTPSFSGVIAAVNMAAPDNLLNRPGNFAHTLMHEVGHGIEEFAKARGLRDSIAKDFFKNYYVDQVTGEKIPTNDGVYGDEEADADAEEYLSHFDQEGQDMLKSGEFADLEKRRAYARSERFAEAMALSAPQDSLLRTLNSPVQAAIDWLATVNANGRLGAARDAVVESGWVPGLEGAESSVLAGSFSPKTLAAIRNYQRALMAYNGRMQFHADGESQVEVPILKILKSPALQRKFQDLDLFETQVSADVFDASGKKLAEIKILDPAFNQGGEYTWRNGRFETADGQTAALPPEVASMMAAMPGEAKVTIQSKIARNPDGTPKLLSEKERESRSKNRGMAIRAAIDGAADAQSIPTALKDTGNGSYRGVMTPGQLAAIDALPETLVPRVLKRKIFAFNDALARGDGTRFLIEYQAALKGGKYRALSPRIRDVIPIGFQFSKQGNFLATTASVSRMFDKLNYYSEKMPEMLAPWAGDQTRFMQDLSDYLQNHAKGLPGETGLDIDMARALDKKNILNDFLNMFDKETEAANPIRTKIRAKRGQDSPDRIIMSARMDRINAMEESTADKLPLNYGLIKRNFLPSANEKFSAEKGLQAQDSAVKRLQRHENTSYRELGNRIAADPAWRLSVELRAKAKADAGAAPSFDDLFASEVAALEQSLPELDLTGLRKIDGASEHDVLEDPTSPGHILKATLPGEFGGIQLDENGLGSLQPPEAVNIPSTWSSALRRVPRPLETRDKSTALGLSGVRMMPPAEPSVKRPRFNEQDKEDLAYLIHDKSHLGDVDEISAIEKALKPQYARKSGVPLFRGTHLENVDSLKPGDAVNFDLPYLSFSEDLNLASRFAKNVVLKLEKGASGFDFWNYMTEDLRKLKKKDPEGYEMADGDFLLEALTEEKEWIVHGGSFRITQIERASGVPILTVEQTSRGTKFMPGRYSKPDGSFDRKAWLEDQEKAKKLLNSRGVYEYDSTPEEWKRMLRDALREPKRD